MKNKKDFYIFPLSGTICFDINSQKIFLFKIDNLISSIEELMLEYKKRKIFPNVDAQICLFENKLKEKKSFPNISFSLTKEGVISYFNIFKYKMKSKGKIISINEKIDLENEEEVKKILIEISGGKYYLCGI